MKERQRFRDGEEPLVGKADFHDAGLREVVNSVFPIDWDKFTDVQRDIDLSTCHWAEGVIKSKLDAATLAAASASAPAADAERQAVNQAIAELWALRDGATKILDKWDDGKNNYRGKVILGELRKVVCTAATAERPAGTPAIKFSGGTATISSGMSRDLQQPDERPVVELTGGITNSATTDDSLYAAYANHCAIQGAKLMTAISWRKARFRA